MNKKCKTCKETKEISEFFPSSKYKGKQYYRGECKLCTNAALRTESGRAAQEKYRNSSHGKVVKASYKKREDYRKKQTRYTLNRRATDPFFKSKFNIRVRLLAAIKRKSWTKKFKFSEYIGCTQEELIKHLESKFTEGMTWENQGKWHIDHIIPLSSATSEEELYKLCHYTNLQPLWALDNIKKSNKIS